MFKSLPRRKIQEINYTCSVFELQRNSKDPEVYADETIVQKQQVFHDSL